MTTRTVYSTLSTEELIDFAVMRDNRSELEIELAERLEQAVLMLAPQFVSDSVPEQGSLFGHG